MANAISENLVFQLIIYGCNTPLTQETNTHVIFVPIVLVVQPAPTVRPQSAQVRWSPVNLTGRLMWDLENRLDYRYQGNC